MSEEKWVTIQSYDPRLCYKLSSHGQFYREKIVYLDRRGRERANDGTRVVKKSIKRIECQSSIFRNEIYVYINTTGKSRRILLASLIKKYFMEKPAKTGYYIEFIDGDSTNVTVDNMRWCKREWSKMPNRDKNMKEYLKIKKSMEKTTKIYKIPDWHILYAKYDQYLKNSVKAKSLILSFMQKHNLYSGLVKIGNETINTMNKGKKVTMISPYFMFNDKDPDILDHDIKLIGDQVIKKNGYYSLRRKGSLMKEWKEILKKNDNFQILDIPNISEYIAVKKDDTEHTEGYSNVVRTFAKEGDDLYLKIVSYYPIKVVDDFIEVEGKEGLF